MQAILDHRVVWKSRLRNPEVGSYPWIVGLVGSSVDTGVLVRSLRVSRGMLY